MNLETFKKNGFKVRGNSIDNQPYFIDGKNITEVKIETGSSYYIISENDTGDIIRITEEQKDHRAGGEVYPYQFTEFGYPLWMMLDDIIKEELTKEEDVLFLKSNLKKLLNATEKLTVFSGFL